MRTRAGSFLVVMTIVLAACGGSSNSDNDGDISTGALFDQLIEIDEAVAAWRNAPTIELAHVNAETAANLVVGPNGPGYGDRNGDGTVGGGNGGGVLPGLAGTPIGLAGPPASNDCIERDVLGGSWNDPDARWEIMLNAIDAWRPNNNTMPSLPSHPMRVVGWATFTLASDSVDEAHEYAGHAKLHVDWSLRAIDC